MPLFDLWSDLNSSFNLEVLLLFVVYFCKIWCRLCCKQTFDLSPCGLESSNIMTTCIYLLVWMFELNQINENWNSIIMNFFFGVTLCFNHPEFGIAIKMFSLFNFQDVHIFILNKFNIKSICSIYRLFSIKPILICVIVWNWVYLSNRIRLGHLCYINKSGNFCYKRWKWETRWHQWFFFFN